MSGSIESGGGNGRARNRSGRGGTPGKGKEGLQGRVDGFTDPVLVLDGDGLIVAANAPAAQAMGADTRQLSGKPLREFLADDGWERIRQAAAHLGQDGLPAPVSRLWFRHESRGSAPFDAFVGRIRTGTDEGCCFLLLHPVPEGVARQTSGGKQEGPLPWTILEEVPWPIMATDIEVGEIVYANRFAAAKLGYTQEELVGMPPAKLHRPEDFVTVIERFGRLGEGEHGQAPNVQVVCKDGSVFIAEIWATKMVKEGGAYLLGSFSDVTRRVETEKSLREETARAQRQESHLKQAQRVAGMGYWEYTAADDNLFWSDEIYGIFSITPEDFGGRYEDFLALVHPEDRAAVARAYEVHLESRKDYNIVHRIIAPDGTVKSVHERCQSEFDDEGKPVRSLGVVLDVTELTVANEKVLRSEQFLRSLVQTQQELICRYLPDTTLTFVNRAYCETFGGTEEELKGTRFIDWVLEEDRATVLSAIALFEGGTDSRSFAHKARTAQGDIASFEWTDTAIRDKQGNLVEIQSTGRDITERIRSQAQLQEALARLDAILRASPDIMFVLDSECRVVDCQPRDSTLFYDDPDEFLGKHIADVVPPDLVAMTEEKVAATLFEGSPLPSTYHLDFPEGRKYFESRYFPYRDNQVLAIVRDITRIRRAELAQQESEQELERLYEHMAQGVVFHDSEGRVIRANPAAERILGISLDQMMERALEDPLWVCVREDGSPLPAEELPTMVALRTGEPVRGAVIGVRRPADDRHVTLMVDVEPEFRPGEEKPFQAFITLTDITALRAAREELLQKSRVQQLLMKIATTYINLPLERTAGAINESLKELGEFIGADRFYVYSYDPDHNTASNTHEWCAEGIEPQIGELQNIPMTGLEWWFEAHQEGRIVSIPDITALPPDGAARAILEPQGIKSLIEFPLMENGAILGVVGMNFVRSHHRCTEVEEVLLSLFSQMLVSMTLRARAANELEENRRFLSDIIENSNSAIAVKDRQGRFTFANRQWEEFTGISRSAMIGKADDEIFDPEPAAGCREGDERVFSGEERFQKEQSVQFRGAERHSVVTKFPVRDHTGTVSSVCTMVMDITERRQMELELRRSEEVFRSLFEDYAAPKLIIEPSDGRIMEANEAAARFYGWPRQKMQEMYIWQINTLPREEVSRQLTRASEVGNIRFRFRHRKSDGTEADVDVFSSPITIRGRRLLHSIIHDVTELRKAEQQLRLLSSSVEQSPVLIVITDVQGNIEYINPAVTETTGYAPEEVLGKNPRIWKSGVQSEEKYRTVWETILSGRVWAGELCNRKKNGEFYWESARISPVSNDQGKITHFVAVGEDITERRRVDQIERRRSDVLSALATGEPLTDILDSVVALVEEVLPGCTCAIYRLHHETRKLLAASAPNLPYEYGEAVTQKFELQQTVSGRAILSGESVTIEDLETADLPPPLREIAQRTGLHACWSDPIFSSGGDVLGALTIYMQEPKLPGMEELRQMRRALALASLALEHERSAAERLARAAAEAANQAKSLFLANMSHEIRTPLNAIIGFTQILVRDSSIPEEQMEQIRTIGSSGEHLLTLVNEVLDMSKIESGTLTLEPTAFPLDAFLEETGRLFAPRAKAKGLDLSLRKAGPTPEFVKGDEGKLRQIFNNLLGNAIKFTRSGRITVYVRSEPPSGSSGWRSGDQVTLRVEVEDTGVGMSGTELEQAFEPFYQAEEGQRAGGTGLGLPLAKRLVELMGGELTVRSKRGVGSTFAFHVQLEAAEGSSKDEVEVPRDIISPAGHRVLIVDDRDDNRELVRAILEPIGFEIVEASSGESAVERFGEYAPDAVIMDLRMPGMDGFEATRRIKATRKGAVTPVIIVTADVAPLTEQEAMTLNVAAFIRKPISVPELMDTLRVSLGMELHPERTESSAGHTQSKGEDNRAAAARLPQELLSAMRSAVASGNMRRFRELVVEVEAVNPALAGKLRQLARQYDYEELNSLLGVS